MSENKKNPVYFQDKNPYNPYNLKKIRTIRTILGLQNKKSVQSVHFGHPLYLINYVKLLSRIHYI